MRSSDKKKIQSAKNLANTGNSPGACFPEMQISPFSIEQVGLVIFDSLQEGIVAVDKDLKITAINDVAACACGYEKNEMQGKSIFNFIDEQEFKRLSDLSKQSAGKETEFVFRKRDGTDAYLCMNIGIIYDEHQQFAGIISSLKDISERKIAEQEIVEKNRIINSLLETSPDFVFMKDAQGHYILINKAFADMFNIAQETVSGKTDYEILPAGLADQCARSDQEVIRTGKSIRIEEETCLYKDELIYLETVKCPILDEHGDVVGIVGAARNITARKETEKMIKERSYLGWMISSISEELINIKIGGLKSALIRVMQKIGSYVGLDRGCIVIFSSVSNGMFPAYYWCTDGITQLPFYINDLMKREGSSVLTKLNEGKVLCIHGVDSLYDSACVEETIIQREGVKSLVIFPILSGGTLIGYMGLDSLSEKKELSDVTQAMLQVIVNVISRTFERIKADEALKKSESNFREMIDHATDAILVHDFYGNILVANQQQALLMGYSKEEILSMNITELFHDSCGRENGKNCLEKLSAGEPVIFERVITGKNGNKNIIEVRLTKTVFNGHPAVVSISRDITERKKVEQALCESEQNLRELIEQAVDGIIVCDLDGNIMLVNDRKCHLLGYSKEEFLSHNMTYFFDDIIRENHVERYWKKMQPGDMFTFAREEVRKDSSTFPAEIKLTKITYGGKPSILAVTRDITAQKKAEQTIREERDRAQKYLDVAGVLIMAMDANGTVEMINSKGCEVLGYEEKEIIGKNWFKTFIPQEDRAKAVEGYINLINAEEAFPERLETDVVTANGARRIISWNTVALRDDKGAITGMLRSGEDITEHRKAEREKKEMESRARLATHLASIGEMASGVAHEINNPLTGVIGYSQLLLREDIPENLKDNIRIIHDGAQRVSDIVGKLLSFARQNRAERTFVNINQLLENTLALMAYELRKNNIEVFTYLLPDLPLTLADGGQLQQVFLNIVRNALLEIKRSKGQGLLRVSTSRRQDHIIISFEDDGPGIEAKYLHKIFDPFFTTRKVGEGTGLGLSVCHGIITEHGGTISVDSTPGEGATFILDLPIITEAEEELIDSKAHVIQYNALCASILIVDDEPNVQRVLKEVLSEDGHKVEITDNAMDALDLVDDNSYDLIVLDIVMPGMNGIELYKKIKEKESSTNGKMLFITGDILNKDTESFLNEINANFIVKPFDVRYFKHRVNTLLNNKS